MIDQLLRDIGLSDKEATMYVTLLRHGNQTISFLAKKANFNRGTGYVILHQLLEKGLAKKSSKGKVQYFAPLDPASLLSYLDAKKQQIESSKDKVQAMMGQLAAITNPLSPKPKIEFFDGADGARTVLENALQAEEGTFHAFLSLADVIAFVGADYYEDFEERRIKAGYELHVIRTREKDKQAIEIDPRAKHHTTSAQAKREVRYASADLAFPMTMYLFDDKLAILSSAEENFAVLMQSRELVSMQRKLFDLLWDSLDQGKIKVGILHSLSGTMAISERSLVDAELMAIDGINEAGGLLGKQIEPIVMDGASDPAVFAQRAEELITKEDVCSIFGGWTSASRKTMLPVIEKHDHLLWYPVQYEGLEQSPNVIYTGATSNQQAIPAVDWVIEHLGKKCFLVGSDYVFPRSANAIMRERIEELGGTVVGEAYRKLGDAQFGQIVQKIKDKKPDVIINTINGDSNIAFFEALRAAGITNEKMSTMSLSMAEEEISRMNVDLVQGDYATWNYFQSIDEKENQEFVQRFKDKHGQHRVVDDPIEAAYHSVHLFAQAVRQAGTEEVSAILQAARGASCDDPEGEVKIDPDNQHVHRKVRVGQIRDDGQFDILWTSKTSIEPEPYPKYKSKEEWQAFLDDLYEKWGKKWAKE